MNIFKRKKINLKLIGKKSIFIEKGVKIGKNVVIYPNNTIVGNTIIGDNVIIYPNNYIKDCKVDDGAVVEYSYIENSEVGENSHIGPNSRLRPNSVIGKGCKIGNFVEIKNSIIGDGTKASHLAYVGDAEVGKNCNIGCGVVFVNYNGKEKNKSIIGDNCFIGSNVNVVAPVKLADNSYICAGTTITINTNPYDFVIGRCREVVKPNYASKYEKRKKQE